MKKYVLVLVILVAAVVPFFLFEDRYCPLRSHLIKQEKRRVQRMRLPFDLDGSRKNILRNLKLRKDKLALAEAEKILLVEPGDLCALWAKAEIFRRTYRFQESEKLLKQILSKYPAHASSLISLSYMRYHEDKFEEASGILQEVLGQPDLDRENKALVYMLMGSINAKKASLGGFLYKVAYGTRVGGFFVKAKTLAPDLSEVRLGLGTFYLLAPRIVGGNIDKAIQELEYAVKLTPDFATVNARLAQAYKKKGDVDKFNLYILKAEELDPENEALREIKGDL
ncbi:MAG: tetratricopeptide repeat protein [Candidatus Omnitrophica bacterium]|nr:tetratricopeptide repeat protein [Candidatus Omnitrophota bacterium]MBU4346759.1 tetratricopeptide repeat protein [Candidatus Omnitrophota bacterium]MBU4473271.1 tetratricopeptide repeat protein [Candidatus Omnitrophota bacterium]MCG2706077.1 tetratricopeptide repeat protein [Candidatus Omnitrophota bacterium]